MEISNGNIITWKYSYPGNILGRIFGNLQNQIIIEPYQHNFQYNLITYSVRTWSFETDLNFITLLIYHLN